MRILHLIQKPQLRGAEIFACQLAAHLVRRGHQCKVVSLFPGEAVLPFSVDQPPIATHQRMRWFDLPGWWRLNRLVREFKPDIIQANAADTLKYAVFSRLVFRWNSIVVFRNANLMSSFLDGWLKRVLNKWTLQLADQIISVSDGCSGDLVSKLGVSGTKISTVEIGIELEDQTGSRTLGPVDLGLDNSSPEGPLLVSVAGFVPEKNHEGLIRIFNQIRKSFPTARLLLVGVGPLMKKIEEQVSDLGLTGTVIFLGRRTDVLRILGACDALLMPSFIEGLPGAILEAMYTRCVVVANAVGGIPDVVTNNVTGILAKAGDEQDFAEAVFRVIPDADARQKITETAYAMVSTRFDNRIMAGRFEEIYARHFNEHNSGY